MNFIWWCQDRLLLFPMFAGGPSMAESFIRTFQLRFRSLFVRSNSYKWGRWCPGSYGPTKTSTKLYKRNKPLNFPDRLCCHVPLSDCNNRPSLGLIRSWSEHLTTSRTPTADRSEVLRHLPVTWCPHWSGFTMTVLRETSVMDVMSLCPTAGLCWLGSITIELQKSTRRPIDRWRPQTETTKRPQSIQSHQWISLPSLTSQDPHTQEWE